MSQVKLSTQSRDDFGKGAARQLRREGRVPAVIYGDEEAVRHVSLDSHDLDQALKVAQVVLELDVDGTTTNAAPRQIQRDPIRRIVEHVDLVVLSSKEVRERLVVGAAVGKATERAIEEDLEPVTVITSLHIYLDEGLEPDEAIEKAIEDGHEQVKAQALAAAAAAEAEEAAAAAAAEAGEGAEGEAAAGAGDADSGGDSSSDDSSDE